MTARETTAGLEAALDFAGLEAAGEGSRWTILRRMERGDFPQPDYYVGRYPRWLASTVRRRRDELIAQRRAGPSLDRGRSAS